MPSLGPGQVTTHFLIKPYPQVYQYRIYYRDSPQIPTPSKSKHKEVTCFAMNQSAIAELINVRHVNVAHPEPSAQAHILVFCLN